MPKPEFLVGVDVAKPHLDVAFAGEDIVWRVSHDAAGLTELCARLAAAAPAQIVMEATGGLETEVAVVLSAAMRKLFTILNAMIKAQKPWIEDHFPLLET